MDKLTEARKELKAIYHGDDDKPLSAIISKFHGWTVLISKGIIGDGYPMVEIISDDNLLKIYEYTEMFYNGDDAFDGFDGTLININGEFHDAFCDIYSAFITINSNNICNVISLEEFQKQLKQTA